MSTPPPPPPVPPQDPKEKAKHSIFAEPAFVACQTDPPYIIDHDLPCPACGFNRRGLQADRPCPECGHHPGTLKGIEELARHSVFNDETILPPESVPSAQHRIDYAGWLARRIEHTPALLGWLLVLGIAVFGGVWAVIGAMLSGSSSAIGVVVVGPVTEEIMKIALIVIVIETRPYLFSSRKQILFAAVGSALGFAIIENGIYLDALIDDPSPQLIAWRWQVCTALHVGCTVIASLGAMRMWRLTVTELRQPRIGPAVPTIAVAVHGLYNAFAVIFELVAEPF